MGASKRYPQSQLNLSRVIGIERTGDLAEGAVRHVGIHTPQVPVIENIQKIKTELQAALLSEPWKVIILQHAYVRLEHSRIAIDVARLTALRPLRSLRKISDGKQAIDIG